MKFNKLQLILAIAVGLAPGWALAQSGVQTGVLAGTVLLPPAQVRQQTFRGDLYRNRLTPDRRDKKKEQVARSPYDDVVVSAHALDRSAGLLNAASAVRMDQLAAQFQPRVLPIMAGTPVDFVNQDRFYHNVFSLSEDNGFNIGRKPTGTVATHTFKAPGLVEVFCDIHPQMSATILVLDTPWFTQPDSTGAFQLSGIPYGRYELRVYHPMHDPMRRELEVGDGVSMAQNFIFGR